MVADRRLHQGNLLTGGMTVVVSVSSNILKGTLRTKGGPLATIIKKVILLGGVKKKQCGV
jgi:hypothetical protein